MSNYYPYGKQWIDDDDINAVVAALKGDLLTCGPLVGEFEKAFAAAVGARHAVAVSSGTAALHIAYAATGLTVGDTVITSPLTFAATANAALYCGAIPVFTDTDISGNIDPALIEKRLSVSTRIIAPVHYAGQPADMARIKKVADRHDLFVIEDACHALGAVYNGAPIGSCRYSDMAVFSLHPVKHITTGEGGVVTTNNHGLYEKLLLLRSHGIVTPEENWKKDMVILGWNYRLTDLQCALGISQLKKLDMFIRERKRIAAEYDRLLSASKYFSPLSVRENLSHAYHLYPILLKKGLDRDDFLLRAQKAGIGLQVHYGLVYRHKYYQKNGYGDVRLPTAEDISARVASLPVYPQLTNEDISFISAKLEEIAESL